MLDKQPPKAISWYLPAAVGAFIAIGCSPQFDAPVYLLPLLFAGTLVIGFLISWPFIMAGYHGYRFVRTFFERT